MFLSKSAADLVMEYIDVFEHYSWMCQAAIARGENFFPIVSKVHYLYHICESSRFLNPAKVWTYEFESFMHIVIQTSKNCLAGSSMAILGNKFLENYLLVLNLYLDDHL